MHLAHNWEKYHLALFYISCIECVLHSLNWLVLKHVELHFMGLYLLVMQYIIIVGFYSMLAMKVLSRPQLVKRVAFPFMATMFAYFTGAAIYVMITIRHNRQECKAPHWLLFSVSMFLMAQILLVAGYYLVREIKRARSSASYRRWKQITLWSLIAAFQASAVLELAMDVVYYTSDPATGCDDALGGPLSASYCLAKVFERVFVYLVPIWVLLYFLRPKERTKTMRAGNPTSPRKSTFQPDHLSTRNGGHHHGTGSASGLTFDDFEYAFGSETESLNERLLDDELTADVIYGQAEPLDVAPSSRHEAGDGTNVGQLARSVTDDTW